MMSSRDADRVFALLELSKYETTALQALFQVGRTTAPALTELTDIPKARIYEVLNALADRGFVEVTPTRPKEYAPKSPAVVLDRAVENERDAFESQVASLEMIRAPFIDAYQPLFEEADVHATPTEELFTVVDVGSPSERETRRLYDAATARISVITKSFAYLDAVRSTLNAAIERGVDVQVLLLRPAALSTTNREIQAEHVATLSEELPPVKMRFDEGPLPIRGTLCDPSMSYTSGQALILVEELDVPLSLRQAALTENASLVAGLQRFFDLLWEGAAERIV